MPKRNFALSALATMLTLALATPSAFACTLERNAWGVWVGKDCYLRDLKLELSSTLMPRDYLDHLLRDPNLPDLNPVDANMNVASHAPGLVDIEIKTRNLGPMDSGSFDVTVVVESRDANNNVVGSDTITTTVAGIRAMDNRRDIIGRVFVPTPNGNSIHVWATVDTGGSPPWGDVTEANETNNMLINDHCTIDYDAFDPCDD